jgi:hypothetical protein
MKQLLLVAALTGCWSCAPEELANRAQSARAAIVGGSNDFADEQVFQLSIVADNRATSSCTATLIDERTLLTAAHCVDPRMLGARTLSIVAMNRADDSQAEQRDFIKVVETRYHPHWNPNTLENDLGMAVLERAPSGVAPVIWNDASVTAMSGETLRAVGYGTTGMGGTGGGVKREVYLSFRQVTPELIMLGDQSSQGICHGDSGGPSFHTFPDGIERLVGVHSFTLNQSCLDGADTRVDAQASIIRDWLNRKEPPNDCIPNGVCAEQPCESPDVDCIEVGKSCTDDTQCSERRCLPDSVRGGSYCSQICFSDDNCPDEMSCDGTRSCRFKVKPNVVLERAKVEVPAAGQGCAAAGAELGAWLALAGLVRRKRSR